MHFPHSLKNPTKPVLSVFSTSILIVNFPFLIINASFALMPTDGISSYKSKWLSTDKPMSKSQEYGLHTLVAKDPLTAGVTDVVAVHGLNGHYEKTWTEEVSQYNWLRDTFPGPTRSSSSSSSGSSLMVRVMSFAYSSKVQFSRSTASIHDFASQLLECLLVERQSDMEKRRPIVFICHSLGGIVFKQVSVTFAMPLMLPTSSSPNVPTARLSTWPVLKVDIRIWPRDPLVSCSLEHLTKARRWLAMPRLWETCSRPHLSGGILIHNY